MAASEAIRSWATNMSAKKFIFKKRTGGAQVPIAGTVSVGRSEESGLRLVDGKPSRHHAEITLNEGAAFVEDLGSTNGTFVNDRRIDPKVKVKLKQRDRVRFDTEEFELVVDPPDVDSDKTEFHVPSPPKPATPDKPVTPDKPAVPQPPKKSTIPGAIDPGANHTIFIRPGAQATPSKVTADSAEPAHLPGDAPYLLTALDGQSRMKIALSNGADKRVWQIGSDEDRDIRFDIPGMSAKHAWLTRENQTWLLTDDLSVNGTFVNDKKILSAFLRDGDRIRFGPVACVFRIPPLAHGSPGLKSGRMRKVLVILGITFVITLVAILVVVQMTK